MPLLWAICVMGPCVESGCFRMADQFKHFDNAFPYRLALKFLFDGHTLKMAGLNAMQFPNYDL